MKAYEYSGKFDYLTAVLAASGTVISGGILGLAHGGLTGINPYSQILWDFFVVILVGGSQGKAVDYAIRSARIRNATVGRAITLLGVSVTIYFCWVGWFTKRAGQWVWKPVDLFHQMESTLAAYPNAVVPAYWYWLLISGWVVGMIVSNNKWNRLGICERCEEWCAEAPDVWSPPRFVSGDSKTTWRLEWWNPPDHRIMITIVPPVGPFWDLYKAILDLGGLSYRCVGKDSPFSIHKTD